MLRPAIRVLFRKKHLRIDRVKGGLRRLASPGRDNSPPVSTKFTRRFRTAFLLYCSLCDSYSDKVGYEPSGYAATGEGVRAT